MSKIKSDSFAGSEVFAAEKFFRLWELKRYALLTSLTRKYSINASAVIVNGASIMLNKKSLYALIEELDAELKIQDTRISRKRVA